MVATCAVCALDPAAVAAACAGVSQRAAAAALGVPKTTLLRHLASHAAPTVQATVPAGPVVFHAATPPAQTSAPVAAPASPVAAPSVQPAPTVPAPAATGGLAAWGARFASGHGRTCATCLCANRADIEAALARGSSYRAIEALFRKQGGPSDTSIRHHATVCAPEALAKAADQRAAATAATATKAMEWIHVLMPKVEAHLERVEAGGTHSEMTAVYRELRAAIETLARITGEIGADVEIKVTQSRDYAVFKALVASTLCPGCMATLGAALTAAEAT